MCENNSCDGNAFNVFTTRLNSPKDLRWKVVLDNCSGCDATKACNPEVYTPLISKIKRKIIQSIESFEFK